MNQTQLNFIKTYKPYALETERKTGISHLFILAQSALETGWGNSAPGNMMFGVKASISTPLEKRQLVQTTEILSTDKAKFPVIISIEKRPDGRFKYTVKDWFRKYDTPEEEQTIRQGIGGQSRPLQVCRGSSSCGLCYRSKLCREPQSTN